MKHAAIAIIMSLVMMSGLVHAFPTPSEVVHIGGRPVARTDLVIETHGNPAHYHAASGGTVNPLDGSMALTDPGGIEGYGLVSALSTGSFLSALGFTGTDQLSILTLLSPEQAAAQALFNQAFRPIIQLVQLAAFLNQIQPLLTMGIFAGPDFVPQPAQSGPEPAPTSEPFGKITDARNMAKALWKRASSHATAMRQIGGLLGIEDQDSVPSPTGDPIHDGLLKEWKGHEEDLFDLTFRALQIERYADDLVAQVQNDPDSVGPPGLTSPDTTTPQPAQSGPPTDNEPEYRVIPDLGLSPSVPANQDTSRTPTTGPPGSSITDLRKQAKNIRDQAQTHLDTMEQMVQLFGPGTEWVGSMVPLPNGDSIHDALVDNYMKHRKAGQQLTAQADKLDKQANTLVAQAGQTEDTPQTVPPGSASPDTAKNNQENPFQKKLNTLKAQAKEAEALIRETDKKTKKLYAQALAIKEVLGVDIAQIKPNGEVFHDETVKQFQKLYGDWRRSRDKGMRLRAEERQLKSEIQRAQKNGFVTPLPDGGGDRIFPDGRQVITLPGGTGKIETSPDGTHTITGPGGAWRNTTLPSGRSRMTLKDGTTITTFPASDPEAKGSTKVKVTKADGSGWIQNSSGKVLKKFGP